MDAHTVYLLHFQHRYKHAGHYLGSSTTLTTRLQAHANGHGARLLAVVHAAGITWQLARTWDGGRERERTLKRQKNSVRLCPLCRGHQPETGVSRHARRRSPRRNARYGQKPTEREGSILLSVMEDGMSTGNLTGQLVSPNFWPACDNCVRFAACARQPHHPAYPHSWHWGREWAVFPDGALITRSWVGTSAIGQPHTGCPSYQVHPHQLRPLVATHRRYLALEHQKASVETLLDRLERSTPWTTREEHRYRHALQQYHEVLQEQAALRAQPHAPSADVAVHG